MKKHVVILMVIFTIIGCKKKEELNSKPAEAVAEQTCINLDAYNALTTLEAKVEWLKINGNSVCLPIIQSAVIKEHKVKASDITDQKAKYTIKWGDLKNIISTFGYEKYLSVEDTDNDTKIDTLKMVNKYDSPPYYCFSTALINTLFKIHGTDDNTEFSFRFATVKLQKAVIIQVGSSIFYDYSTDPTFLPTDNVPL